MRRAVRFAMAAGISGLVAALVGCQSTHSNTDDGYNDGADLQTTEVEATPAPARDDDSWRRSGGYAYRPDAGADMSVTGLPFPTGDLATSPLLLHQVMPREVRRGGEFDYQYHVTNTTNGTLQNVALALESQDNLQIVSADPRPQGSAGGSVWALGDLGPRETRIIRVRATAENAGRAANCVSVSYNNALCAAVNVVDPSLSIDKTATPLVLRCDTVELMYRVCNTGSGTATNVVIRDSLPNGMTTADGSRSVEIPVGSLAAGECADRTVLARVSQTGEFCSPASASADGGLTAESDDPCTRVVAPELAITCDARDKQFLGRTTTYTFEVSNNGDGPANNAVVSVNMPAGAQFIGASAGGVGGQGLVTWNLGTLDAGQTRSVSVDLTASSRGRVEVSASVNGDCAEADSTNCSTVYEGIPAILLEVTDSPDPVEVGTQTTYTIRVTNQGTAPDTNIRVSATLPDSQAYVSSSGPTAGRAAGQTITFAPIPQLNPGQTQTFLVTIRAVEEEDSRFAVEMTSDQFTRPVRETESTNLYR